MLGWIVQRNALKCIGSSLQGTCCAGSKQRSVDMPVILAGQVVVLPRVLALLRLAQPLRLAVHEHQVPIVHSIQRQVQRPPATKGSLLSTCVQIASFTTGGSHCGTQLLA